MWTPPPLCPLSPSLCRLDCVADCRFPHFVDKAEPHNAIAHDVAVILVTSLLQGVTDQYLGRAGDIRHHRRTSDDV